MERKDLLDKINANNDENKKITMSELECLIIDISRVNDKKYTKVINNLKKELNKSITSKEKEKIRSFFIGYPVSNIDDRYIDFKPAITEADLEQAMEYISKGINRNESLMISSLLSRYKKKFILIDNDNVEEYLHYLKKLTKKEYQLIFLNINSSRHLSLENVLYMIKNNYDRLSNYHHMIISFNDDSSDIISWEFIAKIAIYMENFKSEDKFKLFNKKNKSFRINELMDFCKTNECIDFDEELEHEIEKYYDTVSYGFQFEDLFITNNGRSKVLVMQKVQLDDSPKKCPVCLHDIVRGNSYSRILYKSFECQNYDCPSRSKIGRGKRFDLYSAKRQIMLERFANEDIVSKKLINKYRRDIIDSSNYKISDFISLYSWKDDKVLILNSNELTKLTRYKGRIIENKQLELGKENFSKLSIFKLFNVILRKINLKKIKFDTTCIDENIFINGNSSLIAHQLGKKINIGSAITSPPYYNAREYSNWPNMLCYFIDMMINSLSVYKSLKKEGVYIYNIGDIVDQDNIYIHSNMSKRRQMLGFYSILIFNIIGFNIITNIIWDKGEVQSKRNSTADRIPGYIKPINSYEHNLVFIKGDAREKSTVIEKINTVKKINSKGENILGHTAPFPIEIAEQILPYSNDDEYIMDPFLGSGTTLIMANKHKRKAIGIELDKKYYELAIKRYLNESLSLF